MNIRIHDRGQMTSSTRKLLERKVQVLDRRLTGISEDRTLLDVTVDRQQRDGSHIVKLVLHVPRNRFAASGTGDHQATACREAFSDLLDIVEEYRAKLIGVPRIRREAKRHVTKAAIARLETQQVQEAGAKS